MKASKHCWGLAPVILIGVALLHLGVEMPTPRAEHFLANRPSAKSAEETMPRIVQVYRGVGENQTSGARAPEGWIGSARVMPRLARAAVVASGQVPPRPTNNAQLSHRFYARLPLSFEPNQGPVAAGAKYAARGSGYALFLAPTEAVLVLGAANLQIPDPKPGRQALLRLRLVGANTSPKVEALDPLPGKSHYFLGNDPKKWRTNVPHYAKVRYLGVYPGIDLIYYGNQRQLEYDLVVAPGANPHAITLAFEPAKSLRIDEQGDLVVAIEGGEVRQRKPRVYQERDGHKTEISAQYVLKGPQRVGFAVAGYDASQPLILDPVLFYSTYFGGDSDERAFSVAVDISGNIYLVGHTSSTNLPLASPAQAMKRGAAGVLDAFVAKLNPSGSALVYSTYLGGSETDEALDVDVDASENAYVVGATNSTDFPTRNPLQFFLGGGSDAFVTKLDANGGLVYSTYVGGSGEDRGRSVAVDIMNQAHIVGATNSMNFPTRNPLRASLGGDFDAFVTKLDATGSGFVYSTYLGGSDRDIAHSTVVDPDGNAHVAGETASTNFPTFPLGSALQGASGGGVDAFLSKLTANGSGFVYSTYLGGAGTDVASSVTLDTSNNAYLTGFTASANFPRASAFQSIHGSLVMGSVVAFDAFVTKLNSAGSALVYSTFLGGLHDDRGSGIAVDVEGNSHVTGVTRSTNFPLTNPIQSTCGGCGTFRDAFVSKFDSAGSALTFSSFLGGAGDEEANGITLHTNGFYVVGAADSGDFPTVSPLQPARSGILDAFLSRFRENQTPRAIAGPDQTHEASGPSGASVTLDGSLSSDPDGDTLTFEWRDSGSNVIGTTAVVNRTVPLGMHAFTLTINDGFGGTADDAAIITVQDTVAPSVTPPADATVLATEAGGARGSASSDLAAFLAGGSASDTVDTSPTRLPPQVAGTDADNNTLLPLGTTSVTFRFGDDSGNVRTAAANLTVIPAADLSLTNTDSADPVQVGDLLIYAVTATNRGPSGATGVSLNDLIPAGVTLVSVTASQGSCTQFGGTTSCNLGGLSSGASASLTLVVRPNLVGTATNQASVSANETDPNSTNNSASQTTTVMGDESADLSVTKTDQPDPVLLEASVTYTIVVRNNGPSPATGVFLSDSWVGGALGTSVSSTRGSCTLFLSGAECTLGDLPSGGTATITIQGKTFRTGLLTNTARVSANQPDRNSANNTAIQVTRVITPTTADLAVTKTDLPDPVRIGQLLYYFLMVRNNGPGTATNVMLTDTLPQGVQFSSASTRCTFSLGIVTCGLGTLGSGASAFVQISVRPEVAGTLTNRATVRATESDPNTANNMATITTTSIRF